MCLFVHKFFQKFPDRKLHYCPNHRDDGQNAISDVPSSLHCEDERKLPQIHYPLNVSEHQLAIGNIHPKKIPLIYLQIPQHSHWPS